MYFVDVPHGCVCRADYELSVIIYCYLSFSLARMKMQTMFDFLDIR